MPRIGDGVTLQPIDDDVLTLVGGEVLRLDGVAALTVRAVDGARTVAAIAEDLAAPTGGPASPTRAQVVAAFDRLADQAVVDLTDGPADDVYRRPRHVGACEDGDQVSLIDLRTGRMHVLATTAAEIWRLLTETGSLEGTIAELSDTFPDAGDLAEDTARFVEQLCAQGLLERIPGRDSPERSV